MTHRIVPPVLKCPYCYGVTFVQVDRVQVIHGIDLGIVPVDEEGFPAFELVRYTGTEIAWDTQELSALVCETCGKAVLERS